MTRNALICPTSCSQAAFMASVCCSSCSASPRPWPSSMSCRSFSSIERRAFVWSSPWASRADSSARLMDATMAWESPMRSSRMPRMPWVPSCDRRGREKVLGIGAIVTLGVEDGRLTCSVAGKLALLPLWVPVSLDSTAVEPPPDSALEFAVPFAAAALELAVPFAAAVPFAGAVPFAAAVLFAVALPPAAAPRRARAELLSRSETPAEP
mmetsp:Transcript_37598/g.90209  ORF Transcript_37598/g.90209 Transcript_37598/m.90209 type:complete len:210 (-) Transcript_37598:458-1087(-)